MKKHYDTLGLPNGTNLRLVKKRYRELVMQYHPDINPSERANELFIEINYAYEVLIGKRSENALQRSKTGSEDSKEEALKERIKNAKIRFEEQKLKEKWENELYYQQLTSGFRRFISNFVKIAGLIVALVMTIEYFLPVSQVEDKILYYNNGNMPDSNSPKMAFTEKGRFVYLQRIDTRLSGEYPNVTILETAIFKEVVGIISYGKFDIAMYYPLVSYIYVRWAVILFFLLPFISSFYKKQTLYFSLLYYFNSYIVGALLLTFLLINDRWLNLLTLGNW